MRAAISYAGIPLDGSAKSTQALSSRIGDRVEALRRRVEERADSDAPPPAQPDDDDGEQACSSGLGED